MTEANVIWGWVAVVIGIFCFGSFTVPMKTQSVVDAKVDPVIYQSYKTFWALVTSLIALTYNPFSYTPWGLLSGFFWVPAGIGSILAVNCIGIGVAQGIWSGIIIVVSFSWGAFVFQEKLKSLPISILGILFLASGITGMAVSRLSFWNKRFTFFDKNNNLNDEKTEILPKEEENQPWAMNLCGCTISQRVVGYTVAVCCGVWGGSIMVPLKIANENLDTGITYVFSFGVGAAVVNIFILIIYFLFVYFIKKQSLPSFHFGIMIIPGTISGLLWSAGNYMSIYAVLYLGQAIGFPSVQACLIISGLWGIFYYNELQKVQIIVWSVSVVLTLGGIVILSQMK